jgi:hypothetical protein
VKNGACSHLPQPVHTEYHSRILFHAHNRNVNETALLSVGKFVEYAKLRCHLSGDLQTSVPLQLISATYICRELLFLTNADVTTRNENIIVSDYYERGILL